MSEILKYLENNNDLVNTLINSFIGFLGVIVGSYLTIFVNNIGKLRIFCNKIKFSSYKQDQYGGIIECNLNSFDKSFSDIRTTIDFINEKSVNIILRDIKFFVKKKNKIIYFELFELNEKNSENKKLENLIVEPKSFKSLELQNQIDDHLETNNKIYISFRNGKNSLKIFRLT